MNITLHQKIKIELVKRNITGFEIARKMGVTRSAIYQTMDGVIKSYRLRKAIADAIGMEVSDLWPSNGNGHGRKDNPRTPFGKGDFHPLPPPAGDNTPINPLSRGESERR